MTAAQFYRSLLETKSLEGTMMVLLPSGQCVEICKEDVVVSEDKKNIILNIQTDVDEVDVEFGFDESSYDPEEESPIPTSSLVAEIEPSVLASLILENMEYDQIQAVIDDLHAGLHN